jgi:putative FmdB family regulatory protein
MPTYEYNCTHCGHQFEKLQVITARALRRCPRCGNSSLKRLIGSGAGLIFKGSGFYTTDYRSESYKRAIKKETPDKRKEKKEAATAPAKTDPGGEQKTKDKSKK